MAAASEQRESEGRERALVVSDFPPAEGNLAPAMVPTASDVAAIGATFEVADAGAWLRARGTNGAPPFALVVTSPPYFGARSYRAAAAGATAAIGAHLTIGDSVEGACELGADTSPQRYVERLADIFGEAADAAWLRTDGTLTVVIGDTFARRDYEAEDGAGAPAIARGEAVHVHGLLVGAMRRRGWRLRQEIVWVKPSVVPTPA